MYFVVIKIKKNLLKKKKNMAIELLSVVVFKNKLINQFSFELKIHCS